MMALGIVGLGLAVALSGRLFQQSPAFVLTVIASVLAMVVVGSVAALLSTDAPKAGVVSRALSRVVRVSVPVGIVAITALLSGTLYAVSRAPANGPRVDDPTIDWGAASASSLRVASLFGVAQTSGVAAALDRLEALAAEHEEIRAQGHAIAHAIGRFAIQNNGFDPTVFGDCREIFQSGCYHGVLEAYFEGRPDVGPEALASLCGSMVAPGRRPIEGLECAHGIGHGLTVHLGFDLPAALERCESLPREVERQECFDGVFMENAVHGMQPRAPRGDRHAHGAGGQAAANADHAVESAKQRAANRQSSTETPYRGMVQRGDSTYPCTEFGDRHQRACWSYQYMIALRLNGDDLETAFELCDEAPAAGVVACYFGLGKRIGWQHHEDDGAIIASCARGQREQRDACLRGAMEYFMDTEFEAARALRLCGAAPQAARGGCFRALGARAGLVTTDAVTIEGVCRRAGEHHAVCREGATAATSSE